MKHSWHHIEVFELTSHVCHTTRLLEALEIRRGHDGHRELGANTIYYDVVVFIDHGIAETMDVDAVTSVPLQKPLEQLIHASYSSTL